MSNNMSSPPSNNNKQSSPPNNSDLESLNSSDNDDNKAHSFRERRLTYTRHHVLSDNAAAAVASLLADGTNDFSDDDEMKKPAAQQKQDNIEEEGGAAPSNEKRKQTNDNTDVDERPKKKKKPRISIKLSANNSTTNSTSNTNTNNKKQLNHLPSRILHAGEIVRRLSEEEEEDNGEIGKHDTRTGMYSHPSHPNNHHNSHNSTEYKSKWRRRFSYSTKTPDSQLPFPRYQVGTFSCAGLEPLYDSDYGSSSSDDEESWDGESSKREENGGWDKKESDNNSDKESEEEDCGSSGDGGIYANNSSPSNNNNAGRGKVLPTNHPSNQDKSPISPIKKQKHTTSKINQDRGGITYPYANSTNMALFSVYDGHGERGELVSQFALGEVGRLLEERLVSLDSNRGSKGKGRLKGIAEDNEEESDQDNTTKPQEQQEEEYITTSIKQVFNQIDNDLLNEEDIEPMYSGTTACIVLLKESKLYTGNCGDSRAVLAKKKKRCHTKEEGKDVGEETADRELITVDLSTDQNPDSPGEKERIESLGGFVSPPPEPGLSSRVWLDSSHTQIGLAMARSIGDHAVKGVGVISEPEVTTHTIDEDVDEFVIIATDGVWEFLSSEDAVDIVQKHLYLDDNGEGEKKKEGCHGASVACEALIKAASDKWHEHEGNYRDDITAIVVRLKDLLR